MIPCLTILAAAALSAIALTWLTAPLPPPRYEIVDIEFTSIKPAVYPSFEAPICIFPSPVAFSPPESDVIFLKIEIIK